MISPTQQSFLRTFSDPLCVYEGSWSPHTHTPPYRRLGKLTVAKKRLVAQLHVDLTSLEQLLQRESLGNKDTNSQRLRQNEYQQRGAALMALVGTLNFDIYRLWRVECQSEAKRIRETLYLVLTETSAPYVSHEYKKINDMMETLASLVGKEGAGFFQTDLEELRALKSLVD
jgi:hypothetical protein